MMAVDESLACPAAEEFAAAPVDVYKDVEESVSAAISEYPLADGSKDLVDNTWLAIDKAKVDPAAEETKATDVARTVGEIVVVITIVLFPAMVDVDIDEAKATDVASTVGETTIDTTSVLDPAIVDGAVVNIASEIN